MEISKPIKSIGNKSKESQSKKINYNDKMAKQLYEEKAVFVFEIL